MELTKEDALRYHRQMWGDMQKELGEQVRYNCPFYKGKEVTT